MLRSIDTRPTRITPRKEYESLEKYLRELSNPEYNTLTPEEEVELFRKVKEWDQTAREKFIKANLRFVVSVAKQYAKSWKALQDLIDEWNIWLMKAIDRFDETKWFKFISYAVWRIRQGMLQYLSTSNSTIRRPLSQENIRRKVQTFESQFQQEHTRMPSKQEIMDWLSLSEKDMKSYLDASSLVILKSLDDTWYTDDSPLLDVVPDNNSKPADLNLEIDTQKQYILKVLKNNLKPHEYEIITSHFWLWWKRQKSYEEIAFDMELSRERVRQISDRVCLKLSKLLKWTELHELYKSLNE